ncbi:MAG: FIST N-terminal domain-containing protein [bacterium]|nr:FIST N-terminal domain-containing protein [bacterium]
MIAASVGVGKGNDAFRAGKGACMQALDGMPEKKADALIVFGSIFFDQDKLIEGVLAVAPDILTVGCSTSGELSSEGFVTEKSVVVLALSSDQIKFNAGLGNHILWNPGQAGLDCATTLRGGASGSENSTIVFFDIVAGSGDKTLAGLREGLGATLPVWGGASGDDLLFFETYQYFGGKAYTGSIVGLGLSGSHHAVGVALHGFLPVGRSRLVTKAEGTRLIELDGKPAAAIYEEYFGPEHFAELHKGLLPTLAASYPLGVSSPARDQIFLRNPIAVLPEGALILASPIPFGAEVRLMVSDTERALETARIAAEEALKRLEGRKPKAIIIIDSVTRKRIIGPRAGEEVEIIQRILGRDVPIAGFYGYAEVAGEGIGGDMVHNGSMLIWAIAE